MDITVQAIVTLKGDEAKTSLRNAHALAMSLLGSGKLDPHVTYRARSEGEEFPKFADDGAIRIVVEHTYEPDIDDDDPDAFTQKDAIRQHADCLQMDSDWYSEVYVGSRLACSFEKDRETVLDQKLVSEFSGYSGDEARPAKESGRSPSPF